MHYSAGGLVSDLPAGGTDCEMHVDVAKLLFIGLLFETPSLAAVNRTAFRAYSCLLGACSYNVGVTIVLDMVTDAIDAARLSTLLTHP
jgi:hypothetical protein